MYLCDMATVFCGNQLIGGMEMQPQIERRERSSVAFLLALSGDARLHTPTGDWTVGANDLMIVSDLRSVVMHNASSDWCVEYVAAPVEFWEQLHIHLPLDPSAGAPPGGSATEGTPEPLPADPSARTPQQDALAAKQLLAGWGCGESELLRLSNVETNRLYDDLLRISQRRSEPQSPYQEEVIAALSRVLVYDVLALCAAQHTATDRSARTVKRFYDLLESGIARREREVRYYASRIGVTPKFLTDTIRRVTGKSATAIINSYALVPLKELLEQPELPMTQIAEEMNFHSLSYFSRYASKLLGMTPTRYRESVQQTLPRPIELLDVFGSRRS